MVAPRAVGQRGETHRRRRGPQWAAWLAGLGLVTAAMVQVRASLGAAHVVLAYLVLVLGATTRGGRALGLALAVLAFGCFNFFFVPPYHTLAVAEPLDWLVLGAFLVTSGIAAQLLARAQHEAAEARQRASEVDRLAALGAEALNAARAEDALKAVADVIRTSVGVDRCEVYLREATPERVRLAAASGAAVPPVRTTRGVELTPPEQGGDTEPAERAPGVPDAERLVEWVAQHGRPAAARRDGTLRFGAAAGLTDASAGAVASDGPSAGPSPDFDPAGARPPPRAPPGRGPARGGGAGGKGGGGG